MRGKPVALILRFVLLTRIMKFAIGFLLSKAWAASVPMATAWWIRYRSGNDQWTGPTLWCLQEMPTLWMSWAIGLGRAIRYLAATRRRPSLSASEPRGRRWWKSVE